MPRGKEHCSGILPTQMGHCFGLLPKRRVELGYIPNRIAKYHQVSVFQELLPMHVLKSLYIVWCRNGVDTTVDEFSFLVEIRLLGYSQEQSRCLTVIVDSKCVRVHQEPDVVGRSPNRNGPFGRNDRCVMLFTRKAMNWVMRKEVIVRGGLVTLRRSWKRISIEERNSLPEGKGF